MKSLKTMGLIEVLGAANTLSLSRITSSTTEGTKEEEKPGGNIPHGGKRHVCSSKDLASCFTYGAGLIQVDLDDQAPFPLNQHFESMVLINHDIHPFDWKWNVIPSSFVNYRHHVMILCTCLQHNVNALDPIRTP
jgi:hypothetical protein